MITRQFGVELGDGRIARWLSVLDANIEGRVLAAITEPNLIAFHLPRCLVETHVSATQALIAIQRFRTRRGTRPGSLRELVPDFMPQIPRDAFDGEPLRYSLRTGIVWSVGDDFEDAGGVSPDGSIDCSEPTFSLRAENDAISPRS